MTATLIFTAGLLIGALLGVSVMAFIQGAARLGEDDLPYDRVKVDRDGEYLYHVTPTSIDVSLKTPEEPFRGLNYWQNSDTDAWKHAAVKVPHAGDA